jgi:hypothetical protein
VVWFGILIAANVNGAFRELVLRPLVGSPGAHGVSTLLLCALIMLIARLSINWIAPGGSRMAWRIGFLWLVLTLTFEFLAGRYLFGNSWERIVSEYDVTAGRFWILVPIVTLIAPRWAWGRFAGAAPGARIAPLVLAAIGGAGCAETGERDTRLESSDTVMRPADSESWAVRLDGAGPIRYGMSVADAAAAAGDSIEVPPSSEACAYLRLQGMPDGLQFMVERGRIVRGDVTTGTLPTAHGARIGMAESEVQSLYGHTLESRPHKYDTAGRYLVLVPADGDSLRLVLETDGRVITRYRTGLLPAAEYVEGCG